MATVQKELKQLEEMERNKDEEDKLKLKGKIFWANTVPDARCILKSWVRYASFFVPVNISILLMYI